MEEDGILGLQNDNDESSEEEDDSGDEAVLAEALKVPHASCKMLLSCSRLCIVNQDVHPDHPPF